MDGRGSEAWEIRILLASPSDSLPRARFRHFSRNRAICGLRLACPAKKKPRRLRRRGGRQWRSGDLISFWENFSPRLIVTFVLTS